MRAIFRFGRFLSTSLWLAAGFLALAPLAAKAQESTWVGTTGAWTTTSNWAPFAPISIAIIDNSGTATVGAGESGGVPIVKVGLTGTGSVLVNGGLYRTGLTYIGDQAGSTGSLTLTSGTVTLSPGLGAGGLIVGSSGTGTLVVNGPDAYVAVTGITIADAAGSHGTATVTSGSVATLNLGVGRGGTGDLLINGGIVVSGSAFIDGIQGTATVTSGSWASGFMTVGGSGTGRLQIDGGEVSSQILKVAIGSTAVGSVVLNGGVLRTSQVLRGAGTASFQFRGGTLTASANSGDFISGFASSDVTATGTFSINSNGFAITSTIGLGGSNVLNKLGAGTLSLTGTNTYTGGTVVRSGTLAVDGGVINHAARSLIAGNAPGDNASVSITNGGRISNFATFLGNTAGSTGSATVTSGTWTAANTFYVAATGTGNLLINGGLVSDSTGYVGYNDDSIGFAEVSSGTWANTGFLALGDLGTGSLNLKGGLVSSSSGYLGLGAGGVGSAHVSSGTWANTGLLTIGDQGRGTMLISGSGVVTSGTVLLADKAGSEGTLNIGIGAAAGTLQTSLITGGAGTAKLNFDHSDAITVGTKIEGSVLVTKLGSGTLTLTGSNGYAGGTDVAVGTLIIADIGAANSVLGSGPVTVDAGAFLRGVGTVLGNTTLEGTLAPGNSAGEMHFASGLFMEGTATVEMELASLSSFDRITVDGLLTYDGTLSITLLGGYLPEVGQTFDLFDAGLVAPGSDFSGVAFSKPDYVGSFNPTSGILTITAVPEPTATALLLAGGVFLMRRRGGRRGDGEIRHPSRHGGTVVRSGRLKV